MHPRHCENCVVLLMLPQLGERLLPCPSGTAHGLRRTLAGPGEHGYSSHVVRCSLPAKAHMRQLSKTVHASPLPSELHRPRTRLCRRSPAESAEPARKARGASVRDYQISNKRCSRAYKEGEGSTSASLDLGLEVLRAGAGIEHSGQKLQPKETPALSLSPSQNLWSIHDRGSS